jgi:hypothetical protein
VLLKCQEWDRNLPVPTFTLRQASDRRENLGVDLRRKLYPRLRQNGKISGKSLSHHDTSWNGRAAVPMASAQATIENTISGSEKRFPCIYKMYHSLTGLGILPIFNE